MNDVTSAAIIRTAVDQFDRYVMGGDLAQAMMIAGFQVTVQYVAAVRTWSRCNAWI